ncbi:MAG: rhomboid family intramembrane serine protease [Candidatus Lernaella stagnicola]|nr:rhomboid family intramembrane serine protease [Candidatus Lernaella stagnicola]
MILIFPIGHDHFRMRRRPYATYALIALNIIIYFLTSSARSDANTAWQENHNDQATFHCRVFLALKGEEFGYDHASARDQDEDAPYFFCYENHDAVEATWVLFETNGLTSTMHPLYQEYLRKKVVWNQARTNSLMGRFALTPAEFHPFKAISALFLHADIWHLFGNMLFLFLAGAILEETFGAFLYLLLYLLSGFIANTFFALLFTSSTVPLLGASGAISGLLGAFLVRFAKVRIRFWYFFWLFFFFMRKGTFSLPAFIVLPLLFLQDLLYGVLTLEGGAGVAYFAHVGGFIVGVAFGLFLKRYEIYAPTLVEEEKEAAGPVAAGPMARVAVTERRYRRKMEAPAANDYFGRFLLVQALMTEGEADRAAQEADALAEALVDTDQTELLSDLARIFDEPQSVPVMSDRAYVQAAIILEQRAMPQVALTMYEELAHHYPVSPHAARALFRAARLLATQLANPAGAHLKLVELLEKVPHHPTRREAQRVMNEFRATKRLAF